MNMPKISNQPTTSSKTTPTPPDLPDFSSAHPVTDAPLDAKPETSCGAVIVHNGKVLIVHQENGLSGFPKGHIEPGETEVDAALREVKEETSLDIILDETARHAFSYYIPRLNVVKTVVLFLAHPENPSQIPKKQDGEIARLEWLPFAQVESALNFPEWQKAWRTTRAKYLS